MPGGTQRCIAAGQSSLHGRPFLRIGIVGGAAAGAIGPVGGHRAYLFTLGNLTEQLRQPAAAGGEFDNADVGCCRVYG